MRLKSSIFVPAFLLIFLACSSVGQSNSSAGLSASNRKLKPSNDLSAKMHARSIYLKYLERVSASKIYTSSLDGSDAFSNAPVEIARSLKILASCKTDREREEAIHQLSIKLEDSGYYSKVRFKARPRSAIIRFQMIGKDKINTAFERSAWLPIGSYNIWIELEEMLLTPKDAQYDIIRKKELVELKGDGHHAKR